MYILLPVAVVFIALLVPLAITNVKLKAKSAKLEYQLNNLEGELAKTMVNERNENREVQQQNLSRADSIKEKFMNTPKIDSTNKVTDEELEQFYNSQRATINKEKKLEK